MYFDALNTYDVFTLCGTGLDHSLVLLQFYIAMLLRGTFSTRRASDY